MIELSEISSCYGLDGKGSIQWGYYKILKGKHQGRTIVAFRGTGGNV